MAFDKSQPSYVRLRDEVAQRTSQIVAWTGAGLSIPAGLPSWSSLRRRLAAEIRKKGETLEEPHREAKVAERVLGTESLWIAFQIGKTALGQTSFRTFIREQLAPAASASPPAVYEKLWGLRIRRLLNLNLDRLATHAFQNVFGYQSLVEISAVGLQNYMHLLKSPTPFIVNLHGTHENASSWVLTHEELQRLFAATAYRTFIQTCLLSNTVIFLGLTVDDTAVGGHLENLAALQIDAGSHYWITERRDRQTDAWAEANSVQVVRYSSSGDDHSELDEALDDLRSFVPNEDPPAEPVVSRRIPRVDSRLPEPDELLKESDPQTLRRLLNGRAVAILDSQDPDTAAEKYTRFLKIYDHAVYRAWYIGTTLPAQFLDYTLEERVATEGAFGTVYRARTNEGEPVAVKLLHERIRHNPDLLQSFRRGVKSMRLLSEGGVKGMVPYVEASEIPACAVMEWIEGPDLSEAVKARQLRDWDTVLQIALELVNIVRKGHLLPARVLHRDLRPSNIMLQDFYVAPDRWRVVVLDFDLSWHRGSEELSVTYGSSVFGYLAPEQIQRSPGVSTRHAAVDSFGLGMVLLFMVSREEPVPDEHLHPNWPDRILQGIETLPEPTWHSLPARFGRLINNLTLHEQAKRWDLAQAQLELARLRTLLETAHREESAELVTEEIATRSAAMSGYEWEADSRAAKMIHPGGISIELRGLETENSVSLSFQWAEGGMRDRKRLGKWLPRACRTVTEMMKARGWEMMESSTGRGQLAIAGKRKVQSVSEDLAAAAAQVDEISCKLEFT